MHISSVLCLAFLEKYLCSKFFFNLLSPIPSPHPIVTYTRVGMISEFNNEIFQLLTCETQKFSSFFYKNNNFADMNIKWMINNENKLIRWMQGVGGLRTEMSEYDITRIIHLQCPLCCRDPTWGGGGWSLGRRRCQEEWRHACHSDLIFTSSLTPSSHGCMLGVVKNGPKSCCPMYWEVG